MRCSRFCSLCVFSSFLSLFSPFFCSLFVISFVCYVPSLFTVILCSLFVLCSLLCFRFSVFFLLSGPLCRVFPLCSTLPTVHRFLPLPLISPFPSFLSLFPYIYSLFVLFLFPPVLLFPLFCLLFVHNPRSLAGVISK